VTPVIDLFKYDSYKAYVLDFVQQQTRRGGFRRIALALRVNSSMISQVFRGTLHLSHEQAYALGEHIGLNPLEKEYFLLLVNRDRAGTPSLRQFYETLLSGVRARASNLSQRVSPHVVLNEEQRAVFYSDWTYSAIRLLSSIRGPNTIDMISEELRLPREKIRTVLDFLVRHGLCTEENGAYSIGLSKTYLEYGSPHLSRHHANWRLKAMEVHPVLKPSELAFSSPMTLSFDDFVRVRATLANTIEQVHRILEPSENEVLACLNIDWFEVR
jgi:uncharacterized protein (TIGR02147 family)